MLWHRLHHKYHNTNKDPYDHRKGFFYSHVLSNLQSTSSDMQSYLKNIDMRDVDSDRIVWVQQKYVVASFAQTSMKKSRRKLIEQFHREAICHAFHISHPVRNRAPATRDSEIHGGEKIRRSDPKCIFTVRIRNLLPSFSMPFFFTEDSGDFETFCRMRDYLWNGRYIRQLKKLIFSLFHRCEIRKRAEMREPFDRVDTSISARQG